MSKLGVGLISEIILHVAKYDDEDSQAAITDLLTDIRHFCDWFPVDFHKALEFSYEHYEAEKREDTQPDQTAEIIWRDRYKGRED